MSDTHTTIIGLVGFGSVGKDTVARYLCNNYGFIHISSGDLVRDHVRRNNLGELTRENLQKTANELRERNGADYLTVLAIESFVKAGSSKGRLVISGLRAVPEVTRLKEEGGVVISLTAPAEIRYAWSQKRAGASDKVTFEQFKETEEREVRSNSQAAQNIQEVLSLADITIVNSGSRDDLYSKVDTAMKQILQKTDTILSNS